MRWRTGPTAIAARVRTDGGRLLDLQRLRCIWSVRRGLGPLLLVVVVAGTSSAPSWASGTAAAAFEGRFTPTDDLTVEHWGHTATLLPDGRVLVAGGLPPASSSIAEVYDPGTGIWARTGNLNRPRNNHTATLLPDGHVLVAGGGYPFEATSEVFDPATGTWTLTGGLTEPRALHQAARLQDGRVLVSGGRTFQYLASAEVYDPATGIWGAVGAMTVPRFDHTLTLLPDGTVLAVGGNGTPPHPSTAELFDPGSGSWTATAPRSRDGGDAAILLTDGRVLAVGYDAFSGAHTTSEFYDPIIGTWRPGPNAQVDFRYRATATLLPDGTVLLAGGEPASSPGTPSELFDPFDPLGERWTPTGALNQPRTNHTATLLADGTVLVTGGRAWLGCDIPPEEWCYDYRPLRSAELYTGRSGAANVPPTRRGTAARAASLPGRSG